MMGILKDTMIVWHCKKCAARQATKFGGLMKVDAVSCNACGHLTPLKDIPIGMRP